MRRILAEVKRPARLPSVAYFSMEIGLEPAVPTYSGGLGVLAGDTLRAAADAGVAMVGVTLLYRKGYFRQSLDASGGQTESPVDWEPSLRLTKLEHRASIHLDGRDVAIQGWRYEIHGVTGGIVPVFLLDTDLPENAEADRALTDSLYAGDSRHRLRQEAVLGLGGVALLRATGFLAFDGYHMNEGHSALLTLALVEEETGDRELSSATEEEMQAVRERCVFTTHTPVPAGHDTFPMEMVREVLGETRTDFLGSAHCCLDSKLNLTYLALFFSRYVNGVSARHEDVTQGMFPDYEVNAITNGVHAPTWACEPFAELFDHWIPEWREDNHYLRYAVGIPLDDIRDAHRRAKRDLLDEVWRRTGRRLDPHLLTLGFARRATPYKRPGLLLSDPDRLLRICRDAGRIQILFAGKAHPHDEPGKEEIRRIFQAAERLGVNLPVVYLEEYDMALGKLLCGGIDVWVNTPHKPQEASGTSGMKAALNGVPSLSVLDGWWIEGHFEGVTGWSVGDDSGAPGPDESEADSLYHKLENRILPLYYRTPEKFARVRRACIAINASFFNAQRMLSQYFHNAYRVPEA